MDTDLMTLWLNAEYLSEAEARKLIEDLQATRDRLVKTAKPAKKPFALSASEFWSLHARAVDAISRVHGSRWQFTATFDTVLITLPTRLCSWVGPLGGKIKWRRDHRMPDAKYWPGATLPDGVVAAPVWTAPSYDVAADMLRRVSEARYEQIEHDQARHFKPDYPRMVEKKSFVRAY